MIRNLKKSIWAQIFVIYTRYLIGGTFVFASLIKIKGMRFTSESGEDNPIDSAWHLFETLYASGLYWQFIGVCQLIAGLLLMTQRYAKLGAVVFFPIILNIFVITLSYYFAYTPVITGLLLLANIMLLLWDWDQLKVLLNFRSELTSARRIEDDWVWSLTGLLLFAFTFGYRLLVDRYDLFLWLMISTSIGLIAFFVGLYRHRRSGRSQL